MCAAIPMTTATRGHDQLLLLVEQKRQKFLLKRFNVCNKNLHQQKFPAIRYGYLDTCSDFAHTHTCIKWQNFFIPLTNRKCTYERTLIPTKKRISE